MTTQFGYAPQSRQRPPAPVCRFTREEIAQMKKPKRRKRAAPTAAAERRAIRLYRQKKNEARAKSMTPAVAQVPACCPSVMGTLSVAATMFGLSVNDMLGPVRFKLFHMARSYAAHRLVAEQALTLMQIARVMQRRDHSSIYNMLYPARRRAALARRKAKQSGAAREAMKEAA